jgi:hypothetical protein
MSQFAADRLLRIRWLTPVLVNPKRPQKDYTLGKCDDGDSVACFIWQRRNASRVLIADNIVGFWWCVSLKFIGIDARLAISISSIYGRYKANG